MVQGLGSRVMVKPQTLGQILNPKPYLAGVSAPAVIRQCVARERRTLGARPHRHVALVSVRPLPVPLVGVEAPALDEVHEGGAHHDAGAYTRPPVSST